MICRMTCVAENAGIKVVDLFGSSFDQLQVNPLAVAQHTGDATDRIVALGLLEYGADGDGNVQRLRSSSAVSDQTPTVT